MAHLRRPACEPASLVIEKFGGVAATAKIAGCCESQIYRWQRPKGGRGGLGGIIPHWHHRTLLEAAKARGIVLTVADLYPNISVDDDHRVAEAA